MSVQPVVDVLSTLPEALQPIYRMLTDEDADANLVNFANSILDSDLDGSWFRRCFIPVKIVREQLLQILENYTPEAAYAVMITLNYAILAAYATRHKPAELIH